MGTPGGCQWGPQEGLSGDPRRVSVETQGRCQWRLQEGVSGDPKKVSAGTPGGCQRGPEEGVNGDPRKVSVGTPGGCQRGHQVLTAAPTAQGGLEGPGIAVGAAGMGLCVSWTDPAPAASRLRTLPVVAAPWGLSLRPLSCDEARAPPLCPPHTGPSQPGLCRREVLVPVLSGGVCMGRGSGGGRADVLLGAGVGVC